MFFLVKYCLNHSHKYSFYWPHWCSFPLWYIDHKKLRCYCMRRKKHDRTKRIEISLKVSLWQFAHFVWPSMKVTSVAVSMSFSIYLIFYSIQKQIVINSKQHFRRRTTLRENNLLSNERNSSLIFHILYRKVYFIQKKTYRLSFWLHRSN